MKEWYKKAIDLLDHSLKPVPQELNEIDWKETLSPNSKKLSKHLSAFANLPGGGYLVFGIEDNTANPIGISKVDAEQVVQRLSSICRDSLFPVITIDHTIQTYEGVSLLFVYVKESSIKPVHLKGGTMEDAFIRSGGTTRQASRQELGGLMLNSKTLHFEELHSSKLKVAHEIFSMIDYRSILRLLKAPVPSTDREIIDWMIHEKMLDEVDGSGFYITNFGALAAAYNLKEFDGLARKTIRLIKYKGKNKVEAEKEYPGSKGYAIGFEGLITFLKALLPSSEIIKNALRQETSVYPEIALRELIANALIHQDFTVKGAGPMIEVFDDRISISNPGRLLPTKKIDRLIRTTPESRNEILASAFRRYNICEERGSGLEKAVIAIEIYGLPPLKFEELENSFRVTMYSPKTFAQLSKAERVEAAFQHAVIKYYADGGMTNTSLRERLGMHEKQRAQVSLIIKEALEQNKIKPKDPHNVSTKFAEYVPFWA
ncbi:MULTISPECIES: ATP-binding protein [Roseivirga]|uniref:ATP-binding protein n=1 Tax=Roseivirga TaxID=290180 RepID=UPI00257E2A07|nr:MULTISPECIES: ATP-binding protein [Roseivirga]MEC7754548.1 ATP-binding protein [Bacteroidota bacterium]|tara:strand:+ start:13973 stop:15433 length:1461 start_codon:yes stop_codon:yes gene_type:complete